MQIRLDRLRLEAEDLKDEIKLTQDPVERDKLERERDNLEAKIFWLEWRLVAKDTEGE